jgi:hypothetical protein
MLGSDDVIDVEVSPARSTICSPVAGAGQRELDRPIAQSFCIEAPIYFVCMLYALDKYRVARNECGTKTSYSTPLEQEKSNG